MFVCLRILWLFMFCCFCWRHRNHLLAFLIKFILIAIISFVCLCKIIFGLLLFVSLFQKSLCLQFVSFSLKLCLLISCGGGGGVCSFACLITWFDLALHVLLFVVWTKLLPEWKLFEHTTRFHCAWDCRSEIVFRYFTFSPPAITIKSNECCLVIVR